MLAGLSGKSSRPISPNICNIPRAEGIMANSVCGRLRKSNSNTVKIAASAYQAAC